MKDNIRFYIYKIFIVVFIVVIGSLITRKSSRIKANIYKKVYDEHINFAFINSFYNKYVGEIVPFKDIINDQEVFNEKISYKELNQFDNGIKLTLDDNYPIPIIKKGIVIYIGNKDNLNKTVIVEDENGVDISYGNLDTINVKLYDYVKENDLLGMAKDNTLYLLFQKGDKYLDYKEYID